MKNNTKILAGLILATITVTGVTFASTGTGTLNTFNHKTELTAEQKTQMEAIKTILDKKKAGTTLTTDEQNTLDKFEANKPQMGKGKGFERGNGEGRGMMMGGFGEVGNSLTDAEKTALTTMSDTEKQTFFDKKRTENEAKITTREAVIDKLLAGETLTDADKVIVQEIKTQRALEKTKQAEMKDIRALMEKQKAGTTLTTDEKTKLDTFKEKMPEKCEDDLMKNN